MTLVIKEKYMDRETFDMLNTRFYNRTRGFNFISYSAWYSQSKGVGTFKINEEYKDELNELKEVSYEDSQAY